MSDDDHLIHSSLYISVGNAQQIVTGLSRRTKVQDVVTWLCRANDLQGDHLLLEVWRGCSKALSPWEHILDSIHDWGDEMHDVTLKLVKSKSFQTPMQHTRRVWLDRKRRYIQKRFDSCSAIAGTQKIAMRHSMRKNWKCRQEHKSLKKRRLQRELQKSRDSFKELQMQVKAEDKVNTNSIGIEASEAVTFLNPYLQGEYITSKNKLSKAKQMKKELEKHKRELEQTVSTRQSEILSLETNIEGTQEKIDKEKELIDKEPQDIRSNHDYQVATQKLEDLQNHLKAKQKISQLQSSKIQELLTEKTKLENLVNECSEEIRLLRLETYKDQEEEDREMV